MTQTSQQVKPCYDEWPDSSFGVTGGGGNPDARLNGGALERGHHGETTSHDHESGGGDHGAHAANFGTLFWIMFAVSIPVVGLDEPFAHLIGYSLPEQEWVRWVPPVLGTVMYFWGGWPFLSGGFDEARKRKPGMMLLIALAITVAFLASWGASLGLLSSELDFWWELALLVVVMLLGHWLEMRSLARTGSALDSLATLLPEEAEKIDGDSVVKVDPAELEVGDMVLVRPGSSVPADGKIIEGSASVDESMVTGESKTVRRSIGDSAVAGTIATDSGLRVEITATGTETVLAGIQKLVADAQSSSSRSQRIADRAAAVLFWFALGTAAITAVVWSLVGSADMAVVRPISVLVIACPHALGLAIPLVVAIATERAAKVGVLVKDRLALESMRTVDVVVFDKTGTLTRGEPKVVEVAGSQHDKDRVLALAAAAESGSEHPLAKAIMEEAAARRLEVPSSEDFSSSPAVGVSAKLGGSTVEVGGPYLLEQAGRQALSDADSWQDGGKTVLHVIADGEVAGALAIEDQVRPESRAAIDALKSLGVHVVMITGDSEAVANSVAAELGIDEVLAGVRPEDKASKIKQLQSVRRESI